MKKFFNNKKNTTFLIGLLTFILFAQSLLIAKLYSERNFKSYEVNLVKISHQKDSIDYLKMKSDLSLLDKTIQRVHGFMKSKNMVDDPFAPLAQDSISKTVYLAKVSNRYSQYLVDLEKKLQRVPLGMPSDGYVSSNFGKRKNPIPPKPQPAAVAEKKPAEPAPAPQPEIIEEKDSLGNVIKKTVIPTPAPMAKSRSAVAKVQEINRPPAEADQMQFHKGIDIGVAFGSDIRCTAAGTVIFAGQKGGYGNCVIVSHGNGLATLYAHLSQILVETNDEVKAGQVIAKSGNSGRSTGPHLHYEVHQNNTPVNPRLFLNL